MSTRRLTIRTKLLGSFAVVISLTVLIAVLAITRMGSIDEQAQLVGRNSVPSVELVGQLNTDTAEYRLSQVQHVIAVEAADMTAREKRLAELDKTITEHFTEYAPMVSDDRDRAFFNAVKSEWAAYIASTAGFRALSRQNRQQDAIGVLNGENKDRYNALSAKAVEWAQYNRKLADQAVATGHGTYTSARTLILTALVIALLASVGLALLISRIVSRSVAAVLERLTQLRTKDLTSLRTGLDAMAEGDLTVDAEATTPPIEKWSNDEIGDVAQAVNAVRDDAISSVTSYNTSRASLAGIVGQVTSTAGMLSSASQQMAASSEEAGRAVGEIANAVGDVAQGSQRQVTSVESARTLTDDVVQSTTVTADNATETARAAEEARAIAAEGAQAVGQATEAMAAVREASTQATQAIRDLGAKSDQIGGIVDTITGIAEQTNLLALNAAIEAARAGEQGRGFAVVADEVRKLAEESQEAAQSIASLIAEIQAETGKAVDVVEAGGARTAEGAATVEQARDAFERIGGSVEDVTGRAGEIAAAIQQIAASAQRVGQEMADVAAVAEESSASTEQVSASTEETSASTEQIAASAQELARTAEELNELVSRFVVA